MATNEEIAARFMFGPGHDFRDHDCSEVATRCVRCDLEGIELDAPCPGNKKS
jgi:hypothetical protein